jgi:hypothetical protein
MFQALSGQRVKCLTVLQQVPDILARPLYQRNMCNKQVDEEPINSH